LHQLRPPPERVDATAASRCHAGPEPSRRLRPWCTDDRGLGNRISPGPADESAQAVTFVVGNDNPELFTVQPAVAPNGTLTYKPKLLAIGTANVTIRAVDNGGTAGGGSDSSAVRTFTITIL
jgi:hypothetical protein